MEWGWETQQSRNTAATSCHGYYAWGWIATRSACEDSTQVSMVYYNGVIIFIVHHGIIFVAQRLAFYF